MKKLLFFSFLLTGFSFQILSQAQYAVAPIGKGEVQHYVTNKFDCAIFPSDYEGSTTDNVYTPTFEQVKTAEKAMEKNLKNAPTMHPRELKYVCKHLSEYKRQYFGYTDRKNHHLLYINCFSSENNSSVDDGTANWLSEKIKPGKSAADYWQALYDVDEGQFIKITFTDSIL